jgi:pimeloyl-ACP methyl ester carboxylesterase
MLIMHGQRDAMIPFKVGLELYQAAKLARLRSSPELLEELWFSDFPKAGHHDVFAHPQWLHDVAAFMRSAETEGEGEGPQPEGCEEGGECLGEEQRVDGKR